jgi:hypothetical protein
MKIINFQFIEPICDVYLNVSFYFTDPTNSMIQNWYNSHTAVQQIHCLLWNLKAYYCFFNNLPLNPLLGQLNQVHTLTLFL